ncbi:HAD domain-containing protein [Pelomonas sp. SE-A7]|uniref:HAD domain-containing protein n=1 Tax=Pelomonas sp. SE-A7 TaxID=3054953 RepID=UPI00259C978C|nr:HAD domain-containing protein [Pelomonas sp. SE-A7]MDM4765245.1 HAD domain-containing protein [Pelomonas sp. SE-A7]
MNPLPQVRWPVVGPRLSAASHAPLLFLDFDGVLHPNGAAPAVWFKQAGPLMALLHRWPTLDVVISSSWRFHHEWKDLLDLLPTALAERAQGCTGAAHTGALARHTEILNYWQEHGGGRPWLALDDSVWEFPVHCDRLIACDGALGLRPAQLLQLEAWLESLRLLPALSFEQISAAADHVRSSRDASISSLQRKLRVGYRTAQALLAALEGELVSAPDREGLRRML